MRNVLVSQFSKVNQVVPRNKLPSVYLQLRWNVSSFLSVLFLLPLLVVVLHRAPFTQKVLCVCFFFYFHFYLFNSYSLISFQFNSYNWLSRPSLAWPSLSSFFIFLLFILISHQTQNFPLFNSNLSTNNRFLVVFRFPVST